MTDDDDITKEMRDIRWGLVGLRVWSWVATAAGVVFVVVAGVYFADGAQRNDDKAILPVAVWCAAALLAFSCAAIARMVAALVRLRV